jgi:pimeloyl-ACP methyl ester carboxylesterase
MTALDHQLLDVNGITLSLYGAGPQEGYPVWLLHGFPECWHSWRQQIEALAEAGYRVCTGTGKGLYRRPRLGRADRLASGLARTAAGCIGGRHGRAVRRTGEEAGD